MLLLEGGPAVLPAFPPELRDARARDLRAARRHRAHRRQGHADRRTASSTSATSASRPARSSGPPASRRRRSARRWACRSIAPAASIVEPDLSVPGRAAIFVVGDLAALTARTASRCPASRRSRSRRPHHAVAAIDARSRAAGRAARSAIATRATSRPSAAPRRSPISGWIRFAGWMAWLFWLFVHILKLTGFRNRLVVLRAVGVGLLHLPAQHPADHRARRASAARRRRDDAAARARGLRCARRGRGDRAGRALAAGRRRVAYYAAGVYPAGSASRRRSTNAVPFAMFDAILAVGGRSLIVLAIARRWRAARGDRVWRRAGAVVAAGSRRSPPASISGSWCRGGSTTGARRWRRASASIAARATPAAARRASPTRRRRAEPAAPAGAGAAVARLRDVLAPTLAPAVPRRAAAVGVAPRRRARRAEAVAAAAVLPLGRHRRRHQPVPAGSRRQPRSAADGVAVHGGARVGPSRRARARSRGELPRLARRARPATRSGAVQRPAVGVRARASRRVPRARQVRAAAPASTLGRAATCVPSRARTARASASVRAGELGDVRSLPQDRTEWRKAWPATTPRWC